MPFFESCKRYLKSLNSCSVLRPSTPSDCYRRLGEKRWMPYFISLLNAFIDIHKCFDLMQSDVKTTFGLLLITLSFSYCCYRIRTFPIKLHPLLPLFRRGSLIWNVRRTTLGDRRFHIRRFHVKQALDHAWFSLPLHFLFLKLLL